jgi:RNA polymerase subunit RPABC4/transcription elongation factor Spt4
MSSKKPPPLIPRRAHDRCPVCGEISYSVAGVHPQCAVRQADAKRLKRVKRNKQAGTTKKPASGAKPWQRICPKCKALQHVRKKVCGCGHTFAVRAQRKNGADGDADLMVE